MILIHPSSIYPNWLSPPTIPQLFRSASTSVRRDLSRFYRKVCRALAWVFAPPPSLCVPSLARLLVWCLFPLASFDLWVQSRSLWGLLENYEVFFFFNLGLRLVWSQASTWYIGLQWVIGAPIAATAVVCLGFFVLGFRTCPCKFVM